MKMETLVQPKPGAQAEELELSELEKSLVAPFVTNLDRNVFALRNLPEVVKGALFSRYSRSPKGIRKILVDEFINAPEMGFHEIVGRRDSAGGEGEIVAIRKAEEFYDRVLVGYGDDSVAELGGAHLACENVSIIASKVLEDSRMGLSPLEKSTRYVYFDEKKDGGYKYFREPSLMQSQYDGLYEETCDHLFDTYAQLIPKMTGFVTERFPQAEGVSDRAYKSTVRAKVCDVLRGLLPASTLTNVGLYGNGRAFEYLLTKMYASGLQEMRSLAGEMHEELSKVVPSFVKRANDKYGMQQQEYWKKSHASVAALAGRVIKAQQNSFGRLNGVELAEAEGEEEELDKVCTAILFTHTAMPLPQIRKSMASLSRKQKEEVVLAYAGERQNRRNKPGRAFEHVHYTFDLVGNYGMFRDLHRHRVLTQERQALGTALGYDVPQEIVEAGFGREFGECTSAAEDAFKQISFHFPQQAQYVVPMAFRTRWYFHLNLREAFHLVELRTMPQGHRDYRQMCQQIYYQIKRVHPFFASLMKFVDLRDYPFLERLESEKKIDAKQAQVDKKYGGQQ